jgi:ammonium transporter, Amt family
MTNVFLGTALLWFGWFGFNGGSAIGATPRAAMAALVTTVAAAGAAVAWLVVDAMKGKKLSGLGFCTGAIVGILSLIKVLLASLLQQDTLRLGRPS